MERHTNYELHICLKKISFVFFYYKLFSKITYRRMCKKLGVFVQKRKALSVLTSTPKTFIA